ncbi:hypothetical protein AMELA_G00073210 [Ameiurus melas]|uniref:Transmembrane protein 65 n=1 Tax=Ameiurus melas TaxID=219545 RepID=A0A7J6B0E4_AMEME|nr:hypothetical protein AMELA_G00073210 [Ameiurus melas]
MEPGGGVHGEKPRLKSSQRCGQELGSSDTNTVLLIYTCGKNIDKQVQYDLPLHPRIVIYVARDNVNNVFPVLAEQMEMAPPTTAQLRYVLLHNAIPFIGFGFLDNAIMIAAGTQIELSIGVILGISTMAAAALGNLVSDLAGLG